MKWMVLLLALAVSIVSCSLITGDMNDNKIVNDVPKISKFSIFTSAVCESNDDFVHCRDEIFVNCSGKISKAKDVAECHGIEIDLPKATGFAVFGNDWKDPRG